MRKATWNLSVFESQSVKIFIVEAGVTDEDAAQTNVPLRMNLLSHQIALQNVPAIFLDRPPRYFPEANQSRSCVVCFDVFDSFSAAKLPFWAKSDFIEWELPHMYTPDLVDIFQRCLTLCFYYRYRNYNPFYFTTFLFIEEDPIYTTSFFVKHVPVLCGGLLGLRTVVQNDFSSIAKNPFSLSQGKFVLVSPYEHPFSVMSVSGDVMTIQTLDSVITHASVKKSNYIVLTQFSQNFIKDNNHVKQSTFSQSATCNFEPIASFSMTQNEYTSFFRTHFFLSDEDTKNMKASEEASIIEDVPPTAYDFLTEQCEDEKMREIIFKMIGDDMFIQMQKQNFLMKNTQPLSTLDLNLGFPDAQLPRHAVDIQPVCDFLFELLQTPDLCVVQGDQIATISADQVIDGWVENKRGPLSGEKNLHYQVFMEQNVSSSTASDFIKMLSESYTKYRLGSLEQSKPGNFNVFQRDALEDNVQKYLDQNLINDFQSTKNIIIVISDVNFESNIRCYTLFIRPQWIKEPTQKIIDSLSMQMYLKVREWRPEPYGSFELTDSINKSNSSKTMFFGHRLLPAYALPVTPQMSIHIAMSIQNNIAIFTDSTAQTLQALTVHDFSAIKNFIAATPEFVENGISETTLTIFADSLTEQIYNKIMEGLDGIPITILTFFPLTGIQTSLTVTGDVLVTEPEILMSYSSFDATAHCIVVSGSLQAYSLSIYGGTQAKLLSIAKEFAAMSWVSIKPGMEKRTTSFPPHIVGLFKACEPELKSLSPFEFLPPSFLDF